MIPANFFRISIKGLLTEADGRFLLLREDNGKWEFPGGGLEPGEDPIDALRREISEETGLIVTAVSQSPVYFFAARRLNRQEGENYQANVMYEIKLKDLNFTPSNECQELGLFSVKEAAKLDLFPNVTKFLKIYDPSLHPSLLTNLAD